MHWFQVTPQNGIVSFIYELLDAPSFVSLVDVTEQSAKLQVLTTNYNHAGQYSVRIRITDDCTGVTDTQTVTFTVACIRSISPKQTTTWIKYFRASGKVIKPLIEGYDVEPSECADSVTF